MTNTHIQRGGRYYELNLQLHSQVANPYTFNPKQNYKSSSDIKAAVPAYTEKSWTTPGTYTWTVPAGVTRIRVAVCGGGGGGAWLRSMGKTATAGAGGTSSIKLNNTVLFQATGGNGGQAKTEDEYGHHRGYGGTGGSPNGHNGIGTGDGDGVGGSGFGLAFSIISGSYGAGGTAYEKTSSGARGRSCSGGGSGGYNTTTITINQNSNLSIIVGGGGSGEGGKSGNSGFVLIAYGEGIE